MEFSQRLQTLPRNVFADMDLAKAKARASGKEIIDLSLGSSDLLPSEHVIAAIEASLHDPSTHGYLLFNGTQTFREVAGRWYTERFGISIDPETEVLPLIGSQEGTAHLPLAILNPGDYALLQDPGYPSHAGGVYLASGQIYQMPLLAKNNFLPIFEDIPKSVVERARMMVLSYPHNPTTAIAPLSFFEEAVAFCRQHNLVLVHDFPYADLVFPQSPIPHSQFPIPNSQFPTPSILQADPNKEISIEFFTFSKSYNMGGFRIGYAIGNPELIKGLRQVKAVVDFNQYRGILNGAIAALEGSQDCVKSMVTTFQKRRDVFVGALNRMGWDLSLPAATMYVWARLPEAWQENSVKFCTELVEKTGVAASPGSGFGNAGEGYVRFALVREPDVLEIAVGRIWDFLRS